MPIIIFGSSCPACLNQKESYYWFHENCKRDLYLNENAILICYSCDWT